MLTVCPNAKIAYETSNQYNLDVKVTSPDSLSIDGTLEVNIALVNTAPYFNETQYRATVPEKCNETVSVHTILLHNICRQAYVILMYRQFKYACDNILNKIQIQSIAAEYGISCDNFCVFCLAHLELWLAECIPMHSLQLL